jgi:serine/threonine protein kinase
MRFQIGQVVCGKYEVLGILPPPAFGELYRGHAPELGTDVALLVLGRNLLPDEGARQSLMGRVGLARGLRQTNLVWLYDVRPEDDQVVVATAWAGVDTLRSRIDKRKSERAGWPLSAEEAWGILQQISYAVVQMHRDAEVLGDLRADTLIVTAEGLKLFNHGVGCALPRHKFMEAMERAGEDAFVAPEVRDGSAPTVRSDVYSLGALMHELVFGDPPGVDPPGLSPRAPTRPQLAAVLKRALDREPFERPLSVDALLRELQPTIGEPEQPMPQPNLHSLADDTNEPSKKTVIGEVKLPPNVGGIDIQAAIAHAKAAAASGAAPSSKEWGGKNEAVTRQLQVDEVESLLGKNETRQIEVEEIEALLLKSKDPSLEAQPRKDSSPKPSLFSAPADAQPKFDPDTPRTASGDPIIELRPEQKKTEEFAPVGYNANMAGMAPPPLWEDVRSKIQRQERKRGRPILFIAIMVIVAGLFGGAGYLFISGKLANYLPGLLSSSPDLAPSEVEKKPVVEKQPVVDKQPIVEKEPVVEKKAAPPDLAPAATVAAAKRCPDGTVEVGGNKLVCIDAYEFPGEGQLPRVQVSFVEAAQLCGARGARLCNESEWERACRGPSGGNYPYGAAFAVGKCNSKGGRGKLLPSGDSASCKSAAGAFDMSGNAAEWVIVDAQQVPAIKGGSALAGDPESSCNHKLEAKTLAGGPLVGFRCCRDGK